MGVKYFHFLLCLILQRIVLNTSALVGTAHLQGRLSILQAVLEGSLHARNINENTLTPGDQFLSVVGLPFTKLSLGKH